MALESKTIICAVYRSPDANVDIFLYKLDKVLGILDVINNRIIICGDFNLNFLLNCKNVNLCLDIFDTYNMLPLVKEPTRVRNNSRTCIDHIFSHSDFTECKVLEFGLSDHMALVAKFNLRLDYEIKSMKIRTLITPDNIAAAKIKLAQLKLTGETFIEKFEKFHSDMTQIFNEQFPIKLKQFKSYLKDNGWWTHDCHKHSFELDIVLNICKDFPSDQILRDLYTQHRNNFVKNLTARKSNISEKKL